MGKYITEFIGTFFLVLTIVLVVSEAPADFYVAPIAIGAVLMVMIYGGGHISGAHYNPAVTLGVVLRGKCSVGDAPIYMIAQFAGGILAAVLGMSVFGKAPEVAATGMPPNMAAAIVAELLGTFALVWVILNTATTASNAGNSHYGLAIGFTVTAMAYALGGFGTGGCFNPAVAVGCAINGLASWGTAILALVTNFVGGALAFVIFSMSYSRQGDDD